MHERIIHYPKKFEDELRDVQFEYFHHSCGHKIAMWIREDAPGKMNAIFIGYQMFASMGAECHACMRNEFQPNGLPRAMTAWDESGKLIFAMLPYEDV
jgi:hypothetical protein